MPVLAALPFAAGIGTALGVSATAGGALLVGTAAAGGLALSQAAAQAKQAKALKNSQATVSADPSQIVGGSATQASGTSSSQSGRAALISTSPTGVEGLDPTQRRSILGNG